MGLALEQRDRMRIGPRRAPSEFVRTAAWDVAEPHPIDNRMVWRLVLDSGGVPDRLRPAVLAYFGCLHGTGCVERGLGRDKRAVVDPHVGSLRPSAEVEEENSKCLELHRDGPMREHDLFVQSGECDVLLLTEFSRACAVLSIETHGRRFGANRKVRKDVGVVAGKRALGQHTDVAIRRGVRSCYAQIAKEANASRNTKGRGASTLSILGKHRKDLVKGIRSMQELAAVTKGTARYRALTKTKAREKDTKRAKDGIWAGWALDRPVLRLGGAAAVRAASSCAAAHAAKAKQWLARTQDRKVSRRHAAPHDQARPVSVGGVGPRQSLTKMLSQTTLSVKTRLNDCSCTEDLCTWVAAIAFGKAVLVHSGRGPRERVCLQLAIGRERNIAFTHKFSSRHAELVKTTTAIAGSSGSLWRVQPTGGACSSSAWHIDCSRDFVRYLSTVVRQENISIP